MQDLMINDTELENELYSQYENRLTKEQFSVIFTAAKNNSCSPEELKVLVQSYILKLTLKDKII